MRHGALACACLGLALAGCDLEAMKRAGQRQTAETNFVEAVGSSPVATLRQSLEQDRTLANATRWVSARRGTTAKESALTMAIKHRLRDVVELLLEFGADPNQTDGEQASPLGVALATERGRLEKLAVLLEKGADPEKVHPGGSALHAAAGSRAARELLPLLLAKGSGLPRHDSDGWMPLHSAARGGSDAGIRLLVEKGADVDVRSAAPEPGRIGDEVAGTTPLSIVARDRQIRAAATLCALGADPDIANAKGESARQVATRVATAEAKTATSPADQDLARYKNMAAFLAKGGPCDALRARRRAGEQLPEAEVLRIAFESECEAGWGWACGKAGWAHYRGEGAREDDARALALFRRGCETALNKDAWCCGMTGILHVEGRSVPKDPAEGARWLLRGCEGDPQRPDAQACNRLGLLHAEGRGVAKDMARARTLFQRACGGKNEQGCANLKKYAGG
jgi:TPR repeat protein